LKLVPVAVLLAVTAVAALSVIGRVVFRLPASDRLKSFAVVTPEGSPHTIFGRVSDAKTGKPLAGANVYVDTTDVEVMTDRSGGYSIEHVAAGRHQVVAYSYRYCDCRKAVGLDSVCGLRIDFHLVDDFTDHPIRVMGER
jgi:hypothetical protein